MSALENKTVSGTGSFVDSNFAFYYYIGRLIFISALAFVLLPGTQKISSTWILLLTLFFSCVHVCYRKKVKKFNRNRNHCCTFKDFPLFPLY